MAVSVNPSTNKTYVANEISRNVTVIDGTTAGTVTANEAMSHPTVAMSRAFRHTRDISLTWSVSF